MITIGVLSDTHGKLPTAIWTYLQDCDQIWHAGDIGDIAIIDKLAAFKPLKAVYGNIDGLKIRQRCPEELYFTCEGLGVYMTHIAGEPPYYHEHVQKAIKNHQPNLLVCGHTHILRVERVNSHLRHINPGAVGDQGIHPIRTLLRFKISQATIYHMEVIEIGPNRY